MFPKIIYYIIILLYACSNDSQHGVINDLVQNPLTTVDDNIGKVLMPKIQLDKDSFDFGEILQNESITIEFVLKNIGAKGQSQGECVC